MDILWTKDTMNEIYLDAVKIRAKVFIEEQGVSLEEEIDKYEAYCIHFVGYLDKKPAATVRLLPLENGVVKLQRMAVLKEYRKQGHGAEIIKTAEKFAYDQGFNSIILGAQLTAEAFYTTLGYQAYGEIFLDANIDHIHMKKIFSENN